MNHEWILLPYFIIVTFDKSICNSKAFSGIWQSLGQFLWDFKFGGKFHFPYSPLQSFFLDWTLILKIILNLSH